MEAKKTELLNTTWWEKEIEVELATISAHFSSRSLMSLIEAFDHEETGILLWDKNDKLLYRNIDMEKRFVRLNVPYKIGESFYKRIEKIRKKKLVTEKEIKDRINQYKNAKKTKKPQECVVKGPTGRWIQIKDTVTPSGNVLSLMTNVTKIVEQEAERN